MLLPGLLLGRKMHGGGRGDLPGANAALEAAAADQDRVQGMLIEMPVLDNALLACAVAFTPLLIMRELPDARLVEASSILELRLSPERITGEITRFIDECWGGPKRRTARRRSPPRTQIAEARAVGGRRRPS